MCLATLIVRDELKAKQLEGEIEAMNKSTQALIERRALQSSLAINQTVGKTHQSALAEENAAGAAASAYGAPLGTAVNGKAAASAYGAPLGTAVNGKAAASAYGAPLGTAVNGKAAASAYGAPLGTAVNGKAAGSAGDVSLHPGEVAHEVLLPHVVLTCCFSTISFSLVKGGTHKVEQSKAGVNVHFSSMLLLTANFRRISSISEFINTEN